MFTRYQPQNIALRAVAIGFAAGCAHYYGTGIGAVLVIKAKSYKAGN